MSGIFSILILPALLNGCNPSEEASASGGVNQQEAEVLAQIANQFSAAYMRADVEEMVSLYTDDAVIFPNNMDFIRGRDAIQKYWALGPGRRIILHKITPVEIRFSGDMAYDFGMYEISGSNDEVTWGPNYGKYVIVWKRVDGSWKMHVDIWNSRPAPED